MEAYQAMLEVSRRTRLPVHFRADLTTHDAARLAGPNAPPKFGWALRELGTLLLDPRMERHSLDSYLRHFANGDHRLYFWTGRTLREMDLPAFGRAMIDAQTGRGDRAYGY